MSGELKSHYVNPKFEGLPWPADKQKKAPKKPQKQKRCVKKTYSQPQVQAEAARLRKETPEFEWWYQFCAGCQGYHIGRDR